MIDVFDVNPAEIKEITAILNQELELANAAKVAYGDAKERRPFIHTMKPRDRDNTAPYIMCIQFEGHQIRLYADGTWGWECTAMSKEALAAMGIEEEDSIT